MTRLRAWAERCGLHRRELVGWALYDTANSAFWAPVLQVFPLFYVNVACAGLAVVSANQRYAYATTFALMIVAVLAPILGAIADFSAIKKKLMVVFIALGVPATAAMIFIGPGDWKLATALYILGNVGVAGSLTFYDALLPHVARQDEVDRVSTTGFALGYIGSGLMMAVSLLLIAQPARFGLADQASAVRVSILLSALWWLLFSIPILRWVNEPPRRLEQDESAGQNPVRVGFTRLIETLGELRRFRDAFLLLLAFLIYNDGINTIIRMAAPFGSWPTACRPRRSSTSSPRWSGRYRAARRRSRARSSRA
ncbi:MAG: MFS transporter [Vicinamibacteria bacterium]|nr:MFS transporter [Vicinamibacteria bacterium]